MRGALSLITSLGLAITIGAAACEVSPGSRHAPAASGSAASASGQGTASAAPAAAAGSGSASSAQPTPPAPTPTPPTPTPPTPTPNDTANAAGSGSGSGTGAGTAAQPLPQPHIKDTCAKAAEHFLDVSLAGRQLTDEQKADVKTRRASIVAQVGAECTLGGWSDALIDCFTKAADEQALTACEQIMQQEEAAKAAHAPQPPAPAE